MKKYHLGINLGHDRSAAIVSDGEIKVAIQQERLDRSKHSLGYLHQFIGDEKNIQLPWEAINYCLKELDINLEDLSTITANMPGNDHSAMILKRSLPKNISEKIKIIPSHHLSHAYSAYWPSGFDKSVILAIDASGSTINNNTESYSIYTAKNNSIELLHNETTQSHLSQLSTLGFLYEYITKKADFTTKLSSELEVPEAGKLMGLASYGKIQKNWNKWFRNQKDDFQTDIAAYDIFLEVESLTKAYDNGNGKAYLRPYIVDLAFKIQQELEQVMLHLIRTAVHKTGINKLCIAGGVGLNSVSNYKILRELKLENIFVFPAAGDSGIAAGNALWAYQEFETNVKRKELKNAFLGHSYSENDIETAIASFSQKITFKKLSHSELLEETAKKLADGSIIARHEGGCEFGPRALGHRSIIVDPTLERMKDILNARVKYRENFRPFAPVVPEDISDEIFELKTHSPFMLLVADIKKQFHEILPAITHNDGTGRVQTVNKNDNPFFYNLAYALQKQRKGPAVLLNTSFNVAGQPIVETPNESIETYLSTDIDYLIIDNYWIEKKDTEIKKYKDHLLQLPEPINPMGLNENAPDVNELMIKLDEALFYNKKENQPWTEQELKSLSAFGARYKEKSFISSNYPLGKNFKSQIENKAIIFLNPQGESVLKSLTNDSYSLSFSYNEIRILSHCYNADDQELIKLRTELMLSVKEFNDKLIWANETLASFNIIAKHGNSVSTTKSSKLNKKAQITLEHFENEDFTLFKELEVFYSVLKRNSYNEKEICTKLNIPDLQSIEPTYMPYYSSIKLGIDKLDMLISLFLVRGTVDLKAATSLFGKELLDVLFDLKVLYYRKDKIASYIDIFCVDNHYVATDHRFLFLEEDHMKENPVMYIGSDSFGLVNTAPRKFSERTLDLCTGSGIQSIIASKYSKDVIAVDINPRAIRFARFNTQLNGINNIRVIKGDLYKSLPEIKFDTILANPPFVPSPDENMKFRDGGVKGETILSSIVKEASQYLTKNGRLYIVTDLVDVEKYQPKLMNWWGNSPSKMMVLKTADRNEILFSVPHCHYPFNQSYNEYSSELIKWVNNFKKSNLNAVNFGYILIEKSDNQIYFSKTISNPSTPIFNQTEEFFKQNDLLNECSNQLIIEVNTAIKIRRESDYNHAAPTYQLFAENNPFFTEYQISKEIYTTLLTISNKQKDYKDLMHYPFINDLIQKGILRVKYKNLNNSEDTIKTKVNKVVKDTIVEMETKTTPTCLTSYLKQ